MIYFPEAFEILEYISIIKFKIIPIVLLKKFINYKKLDRGLYFLLDDGLINIHGYGNTCLMIIHEKIIEDFEYYKVHFRTKNFCINNDILEEFHNLFNNNSDLFII